MTDEIFRLYANSSFLEGFARLFDFDGELNIYNKSKSGREADYRALLSDWQFVGQDISDAFEKFQKEYEKH